MPEEDSKEKIIRLEGRVDGVEKIITRMENDTARCQALQAKNWDKLNEKLDLIKSNELGHINDRIDVLERKKDPSTIITVQQWIQIILAIIGVVGTAMVAFIQVLGGKIG